MEGMGEASEVDESFHEYKNEGVAEQEEEHEDNVVPEKYERWPGWPGESVFRIVVPSQKVGGIIGRKGESVKRISEETKARIKIFDCPPRAPERPVMVSAKEVPDATHPPAINGLLEVHKRIIGLESDILNPSSTGTKVSTKLLVTTSQAGNLIGKQGSTMKSIQETSKCLVRVLGTEDIPIFALEDDRVVEIVGEPEAVHNAVELVASKLRKFLVDRSIIPIIESQMQLLCSQMERIDHPPPPHPPPQSWGPPPQAFHPHMIPPPHENYYPPPPPETPLLPPIHQHETYYPPPPLENQRHQGISAYGIEPPLPMAPSNQPIIAQVKQHIQIPLSYADAVIGNNGANISYIRRASSATVTIQESTKVPGEMTIEINGASSQVQTAHQLIQNFMAEASQAQTQSAELGFNPYAPPTHTDLSGQTGGYASLYNTNTNYGY